MVTDSTYAVIELLKQVSERPAVSLITRLRLDAGVARLRAVGGKRDHREGCDVFPGGGRETAPGRVAHFIPAART
jgi:hypothetical protein